MEIGTNSFKFIPLFFWRGGSWRLITQELRWLQLKYAWTYPFKLIRSFALITVFPFAYRLTYIYHIWKKITDHMAWVPSSTYALQFSVSRPWKGIFVYANTGWSVWILWLNFSSPRKKGTDSSLLNMRAGIIGFPKNPSWAYFAHFNTILVPWKRKGLNLPMLLQT